MRGYRVTVNDRQVTEDISLANAERAYEVAKRTIQQIPEPYATQFGLTVTLWRVYDNFTVDIFRKWPKAYTKETL